MTILHILSLAGYFFCLYEYIAMRHRVICAESDVRIYYELSNKRIAALEVGDIDLFEDMALVDALYRNRGTK